MCHFHSCRTGVSGITVCVLRACQRSTACRKPPKVSYPSVIETRDVCTRVSTTLRRTMAVSCLMSCHFYHDHCSDEDDRRRDDSRISSSPIHAQSWQSRDGPHGMCAAGCIFLQLLSQWHTKLTGVLLSSFWPDCPTLHSAVSDLGSRTSSLGGTHIALMQHSPIVSNASLSFFTPGSLRRRNSIRISSGSPV